MQVLSYEEYHRHIFASCKQGFVIKFWLWWVNIINSRNLVYMKQSNARRVTVSRSSKKEYWQPLAAEHNITHCFFCSCHLPICLDLHKDNKNKGVHIGTYLLAIQIHLEMRGWTAGFPAASLAASARWHTGTFHKDRLVCNLWHDKKAVCQYCHLV